MTESSKSLKWKEVRQNNLHDIVQEIGNCSDMFGIFIYYINVVFM